MNKYGELSDFEINKRMARHVVPCEVRYKNEKVIVVYIDCYEDELGTLRENIRDCGEFDPCNSWTDGGAIIEAYGISLTSPEVNGTNGWEAEHFIPSRIGVDALLKSWNKKPLRAAMEVFLMMKENDDE